MHIINMKTGYTYQQVDTQHACHDDYDVQQLMAMRTYGYFWENIK